MGRLIFLALLAAVCGCAGARGGRVSLEKGATARDVDTGAETLDRAPKLDRSQADTLSVETIYGALDREVARVGLIAGLAALGLLLGAAASPRPSDARLTLGLYASAAVCFAAAIALAWRLFV